VTVTYPSDNDVNKRDKFRPDDILMRRAVSGEGKN
jgi:hypothetical protein